MNSDESWWIIHINYTKPTQWQAITARGFPGTRGFKERPFGGDGERRSAIQGRKSMFSCRKAMAMAHWHLFLGGALLCFFGYLILLVRATRMNTSAFATSRWCDIALYRNTICSQSEEEAWILISTCFDTIPIGFIDQWVGKFPKVYQCRFEWWKTIAHSLLLKSSLQFASSDRLQTVNEEYSFDSSPGARSVEDFPRASYRNALPPDRQWHVLEDNYGNP